MMYDDNPFNQNDHDKAVRFGGDIIVIVCVIVATICFAILISEIV